MILKYKKNPGSYYPPGYEYEKEKKAVKFLFFLGVILSFQYFLRLCDAVEQLYIYHDGKRMLNPATAAPSFSSLIAGHWIFYLPLFLFLGFMTVYHYFYYNTDTKSIYLMRRLPRRGILFESCAAAPVFGAGAGILLLAFLYVIYYGVYLVVMPVKSIP